MKMSSRSTRSTGTTKTAPTMVSTAVTPEVIPSASSRSKRKATVNTVARKRARGGDPCSTNDDNRSTPSLTPPDVTSSAAVAVAVAAHPVDIDEKRVKAEKMISGTTNGRGENKVKVGSSSNKTVRPTPDECAFAVATLGSLHPRVLESTRKIKQRAGRSDNNNHHNNNNNNRNRDDDGPFQASSCGYQETILDGVVSTMLSQNTTAANSTRAFANLKKALPDWNVVADLDDPQKIETAVRVAGLAKTRAHRIWTMCRTLKEERGDATLEYLRDSSTSADDIKNELSRFPGMGKKTISCVLMFTLGREDEFPVDTHVLRIAQQHDWVPTSFKRDDAYEYLNQVVPNHLKLDLHCLLVQHGRECHRCAARGKPQFPPQDGTKLKCPLVHLKDIVATASGAATKDSSSSVLVKLEATTTSTVVNCKMES